MKGDKSKLLLDEEIPASWPSILARSFWILVWMAIRLHGAQAHEEPRSWGYCPPPYPPDCVDTLRKNPETSANCEREVEAYVASVFNYRACLASESERAVREANHVTQNLRCIMDTTSCRQGPNRENAPR